jgi:hypothetical protein
MQAEAGTLAARSSEMMVVRDCVFMGANA